MIGVSGTGKHRSQKDGQQCTGCGEAQQKREGGTSLQVGENVV